MSAARSPLRPLRVLVTSSPSTEEMRLDAADEAWIARYLRAKMATGIHVPRLRLPPASRIAGIDHIFFRSVFLFVGGPFSTNSVPFRHCCAVRRMLCYVLLLLLI